MAQQQQQSMLVSISSKTNDDLCNWELITDDVSDDDSIFGVQSFDLDESIHSLSSSSDLDLDDDDVDCNKDENFDVNSNQDENFDVGLTNFIVNCSKDDNFDVGLTNYVVNCNKVDNFDVGLINYDVNYNGYYDDHHDDEDDDDDDDDGDDMDDDLVPWEVKGIYMRERIKKCEKKSMTKMSKSKKIIRCVKGKYGNGYRAY